MKDLKEFEEKWMVNVKSGKIIPEICKMMNYNWKAEIFDIKVSKFLITQELWKEVMGTNPSYFKGEKLPVENITWLETLEFCNKLSNRFGLEEVYDLSEIDRNILKINQLSLRKSINAYEADFRDTEGFRLPISYEWEYFCKDGKQNGGFNVLKLNLMNIERSEIDEIAWYNENSNNKTHNVGEKLPNEFGIYDCIGNVEEWLYDDVNEIGKRNNCRELGASFKGLKNIVGGSYKTELKEVKLFAKYQSALNESERSPFVGFRIVRNLKNKMDV